MAHTHSAIYATHAHAHLVVRCIIQWRHWLSNTIAAPHIKCIVHIPPVGERSIEPRQDCLQRVEQGGNDHVMHREAGVAVARHEHSTTTSSSCIAVAAGSQVGRWSVNQSVSRSVNQAVRQSVSQAGRRMEGRCRSPARVHGGARCRARAPQTQRCAASCPGVLHKQGTLCNP
jgi:hypothetical protein